MALKGNKTLKPDNVILVDYKKAHNDDKQELAQIDGVLLAAEAELDAMIQAREANELAKRIEIDAIKKKKIALVDRVAKNTEIIGE